MAQPSPRLGLILTLVGFIVIAVGLAANAVITDAIDAKTLQAQSIITLLPLVLYSDIGVGILGWGIGLYLSSLNPLSRTYLYPIVSGVGIFILVQSLLLLDTSGILYAYVDFFWGLQFALAPSLITSGIVSGVLVERRRRLAGIPEPSLRHEKILVMILALILLLYYIPAPTIVLRMIALILATWLIWHFLSPYVASVILLGMSSKSLKNKQSRYDFMIVEKPRPEPITLSNIISRAYYPAAFGVGLAFTLLNLSQYIPELAGLFREGMLERTADIVWISLIIMAVGSIYVGPVAWIFDDAGVRLYDRLRRVMLKPQLARFADELVELYSFIQVPLSFFVGISIGRLAESIFLAAVLIYTIFMAAFIVTLLYALLSSEKHLYRFIQILHSRGALKPPEKGLYVGT